MTGDKKNFIEEHQKVLDSAKALNNLFKPVVLIQFFATSTLLCVQGFQLIMLDNVFNKIVALIGGVTIITQLFVYSYGGHLIMDTSSSVADLLYEVKKENVMIIQRAQRPALIEVGFFKANLIAFTSVLSSTASLITLLKSLLD